LSVIQGGGVQAGIGHPGTAPIPSFREADSYPARLAGASTLPDGPIDHLITSTVAIPIAFTAATGGAVIGVVGLEVMDFVVMGSGVATDLTEAVVYEAAVFAVSAGARKSRGTHGISPPCSP
jgi:hypothetical protein